jgi:hypothetical protein
LGNRYVAFLLILFGYTLIIEHLGGLKGGWVFARQYLEIGLLLYLYWYLNAIVSPSRWQPFLAAAPIFLAYIGQDIYFLLMAKVFRFIELTEVAELFNVTSRPFQVLIILAGLIPLCGFLASISYRRWAVIVLGSLPLVALALVELFRGPASLKQVGRGVISWSDSIPVEQNGRLVMLVPRGREEDRLCQNRFVSRSAVIREANGVPTDCERRGPSGMSMSWSWSFVDPTLFRNGLYQESGASGL